MDLQKKGLSGGNTSSLPLTSRPCSTPDRAPYISEFGCHFSLQSRSWLLRIALSCDTDYLARIHVRRRWAQLICELGNPAVASPQWRASELCADVAWVRLLASAESCQQRCNTGRLCRACSSACCAAPGGAGVHHGTSHMECSCQVVVRVHFCIHAGPLAWWTGRSTLTSCCRCKQQQRMCPARARCHSASSQAGLAHDVCPCRIRVTCFTGHVICR